MTIHSDIVTALANVAGGRVFPEAAPEDAPVPIVIYKRKLYEPVMTLQGYAGAAKSTFVFECWANTKAEALALADAVVAAIESAVGIQTKFREPYSGEDYESQTDEFIEPVEFSFWHA